MNICVLSCHSPENQALHELTGPSHRAYAERNGYSIVSIERPWDLSQTNELLRTLSLLKIGFDIVLTVDTDVLFTNMESPIDRLIGTVRGITMSREIEGRSPINMGVVAWQGEFGGAYAVLYWLIAGTSRWTQNINGAWCQGHLAANPVMMSHVTVLPPRALNATDFEGEWAWERGDLLCHFLGGTVENKVERVKQFISRL